MMSLHKQPSLNKVISDLLQACSCLSRKELVQRLEDSGYKSNANGLDGVVSQSLHRLSLGGYIENREGSWWFVKPWTDDKTKVSKSKPDDSTDKVEDFLGTIDLLQRINVFFGKDTEEVIKNLRLVQVLSEKLGGIDGIVKVLERLHK